MKNKYFKVIVTYPKLTEKEKDKILDWFNKSGSYYNLGISIKGVK